jgi:hypothetical protein
MEVEESDIIEDDLEEDEETIDGSDTDNVGDPSVEINVEELITELEAEGLIDHTISERATRLRLEELMEMRRAKQDLADFDDYDI